MMIAVWEHTHGIHIKNAGLMTDKNTEWPYNKSGNFVADHGKLPLHVKSIDNSLADPLHCGKVGEEHYMHFTIRLDKVLFLQLTVNTWKEILDFGIDRMYIYTLKNLKNCTRLLFNIILDSVNIVQEWKMVVGVFTKTIKRTQLQAEKHKYFQSPIHHKAMYEHLCEVSQQFPLMKCSYN